MPLTVFVVHIVIQGALVQLFGNVEGMFFRNDLVVMFWAKLYIQFLKQIALKVWMPLYDISYQILELTIYLEMNPCAKGFDPTLARMSYQGENDMHLGWHLDGKCLQVHKYWMVVSGEFCISSAIMNQTVMRVKAVISHVNCKVVDSRSELLYIVKKITIFLFKQ